MKKLKILTLSDYAFIKGGAEKVAILSSIGLSGIGHEVAFFSAVGPVSDELQEADFKYLICLGQKDILDNPNKMKAMSSGIYNRFAVKELQKLIDSWKPDIAHIHGVSKALSWAVINLLHNNKIPIVYTIHDYGLICPNLGIYNFKYGENCDYYKPGCLMTCLITDCDKRNYSQKLWRWSRYYTNRRIFKIVSKIDAFIAVGKFIKELFSKNLGTDKRIEVIYNPIDLFKSKENQLEASKKDFKKFLYVGRLSEEKGVDLLFNAMKHIDGKLFVIGDGELKKYCTEVSKEIGSNKINILGYQDRKTIMEHMRTSAALVVPSKWKEPAPLVLGEAFYNSIPAIVSNHGGLTEFVLNGVNGLHFEAGNLESLIEAMKKILENKDMVINMGEKAEEIIKNKKMNIENHINNLGKYYRSILNNRSRT